MAYYSDSRSSSFSLSRDEWSTSSSFNSNASSLGGAIIPCISHPHYNCISTLKTRNHHHITCLAVHNNLLYAASGNDINVFDLSTLSPVENPFGINGHDLSSGGFIKSIAFCGDKILTAHQDSKIRVWKRHRLVATLPTLKDKLRRFMNPKSYVQVRRDKRKMWINHNDAVSGLAVSSQVGSTFDRSNSGHSNGLIYSVSWDKCLKIWRGLDFKCVESVTAHDDAVNAVAVSGDGTVYTGSADGRVRVWARRNDSVGRHYMVDTLEKHGSTVNAIALSDDGKVLLSGGCDGMIVGWEREEGSDRMVEIGVVGGHDGAVLCLISLKNDHDDDHDLFVSGSADRTVRVWGRGGGGCRGLSICCVAVLEGHNRPVRSLALVGSEKSENGVVVVCSGSLDGEIKVWQIMVSEMMKSKSHSNSMQRKLDNVQD